MAIRFACTSCQRPIEIDDEWANRSVLCPFCRATVTAPSQSTIGAESAMPVARQGDVPSAAPFGPPPIPTSGNLIAVSALVAIVLAVGLMFAAGMSMAQHTDELQGVMKAAKTGDEAATLEAWERVVEGYGGNTPPWLLHSVILFMGGAFAWLAGLVCGLLGLRKQKRRGLAILALVGAVGFPVLLCCGGAL